MIRSVLASYNVLNAVLFKSILVRDRMIRRKARDRKKKRGASVGCRHHYSLLLQMKFLCTCNIDNEFLSDKRDRRFLSYFFLWSDPKRANWRHYPMILSSDFDDSLLEKRKSAYPVCPVHPDKGFAIASICDAIGKYKSQDAWPMTCTEMMQAGHTVQFSDADPELPDIDRRIELFIGRSTARCTISESDYDYSDSYRSNQWVGRNVPLLHFSVEINRDSYWFRSFQCVYGSKRGYVEMACGPGVVYIIRSIVACLIDLPLPTHVIEIVLGFLIGARVERALLTCDLLGNYLSNNKEEGYALRKFRASGRRNGLVSLIDNVKAMRNKQQQSRQRQVAIKRQK